MASLHRINLVAKTLVVVLLMTTVVSSQQKTVEEVIPLKPNSWIIQSPVKRPLPGLSGIGLPPGGILLMTMDPNTTMTDMEPQQQQSSEFLTTAVPSVSSAEETTTEPISVTEVSIVSQSPITSMDVEEVAFTDTLSISTGGTVAITEESNSPTLDLEIFTQQSLSTEIQSSTDQTQTTEQVTDVVDVISLLNQHSNASLLMEALKVDGESDQTSDESVELTTPDDTEEITTDPPTEVSPVNVGEDTFHRPDEIDSSTENSGTTEESQTLLVSVGNGPSYVDGNLIFDHLTTQNSLSNEELTTEESVTTEASQTIFFYNNVSYVSGDLIFDHWTTVSNEDSTTEGSVTTQHLLPDEIYLQTTTDLTTDEFKEKNATIEVGTTQDSATEYSITPIPPKGPASLPEMPEDDATMDIGLNGDTSALLGSLIQSATNAEIYETSTDAGSGAVLSTEANEDFGEAQSGWGLLWGVNSDNSSDDPPDVEDSGSVNFDNTDSANLETENPTSSAVTETEAQQFLVFTTDSSPEDPGLAESLRQIENIELGPKNNAESSNLVASATVIKNAGNSRNLLSEENVKEDIDVTKVTEGVAEADTKPGAEEARQYHRPYPIRPGMRPGMRNRFRPSIDRHDQNFRPEYDDYNFNVISRTYDYCYTVWCKFKKTLSRIGLL